MKKRAEEHKQLVEVSKSMKASKKACQKYGMDYKQNPYCLGIHGNYARELYSCLKYIK